MKVQEFFDKYNGKEIDYDGFYGNQCMDLAEQYNKEVIGAPRLTGDAYQVWENYPIDFYERILNTPEGVPQEGDLIIWNKNVGGGFGHIAISTGNEADATSMFESFDQNWPIGSLCHFQRHDYKNVVGWLHPKSNQQSIIDELRTQRDANWNMYSDELKKNNDLAKQLQDEQTKSQNLRDAFDLQSQADANTGAQLLDAQHERDDYKNRLFSIKDALSSPSIELADLLGVIDNLRKPTDQAVKEVVPVLEEQFNNLQKSRVKSWKEAIVLAFNLFLSKFK